MSTTTQASQRGTGRKGHPLPVMRVTMYERVSSFMMMLVLLMLIGFIGAVSYWFAHRPPPEPDPVPLEIVQFEDESDWGGSLDGVVGGTAEYDTGEEGSGGGEQTTDEPVLEASLASLANVTEQVVTQSTALAAEGQTVVSSQPAYVGLSSGASGDGTGGGRPPLGFGPGRGGGVPRELRWFVKFSESESLEEYARQLDYFKVELGVVLLEGGSRKLVYISNLSRNPPTKREVTGSAKDDQRLYFTWEGGQRKDADVKLCARAGVQAANGILLHFYSPQLEEMLATIERQYRNRNPKEIRRTYFLIVKTGNAYSFKVTGQTYLK